MDISRRDFIHLHFLPLKPGRTADEFVKYFVSTDTNSGDVTETLF